MTFAHGAQEIIRNLLNLTGSDQGCLHPWSRPAESPSNVHSGPCYFDGSPGLELVVQAGGDRDDVTSAPSRVPGTTVVNDYGVRRIVTIGREPAATGSEIVMGVALVDRIGRIEIPIEVLVEAVLQRHRVHIRPVVAIQWIVVVLPARIARGRSRMRPTNADVILRREVLGKRKPQAVSLSFVLKLQIGRQVAFQVFVDTADRQAEIKRILHTGLER